MFGILLVKLLKSFIKTAHFPSTLISVTVLTDSREGLTKKERESVLAGFDFRFQAQGS